MVSMSPVHITDKIGGHSQHSMLVFHKEKNYQLKNNLPYYSPTFLVPDIQMEEMANNMCQIYTIIFNNIMMKIANNYVSINGYLFQENNIHF